MEGVTKKIKTHERGSVRIAKYVMRRALPVTPGYTNIHIHSTSKDPAAVLSPFNLRNDKGQLIENVWQFSKVYPRVYATKQTRNNVVIWEHGDEVHVDDEGKLTPAYWAWREKGMNNEHAVRYPNGSQHRHECVYAIASKDTEDEKLNYIASRKRIYCQAYMDACPSHPAFIALKERVDSGENIQIVEIDGPPTSLQRAPYDQLSKEKPGLLATKKNMVALLNDTREPFGHGFVIASLLMDTDWLR